MKHIPTLLVTLALVSGCSAIPPTSPAANSSGSTSAAGVASPDTPRNYVAHLNADGEIPTNASQGQGQVIFQLNPAGTELSYRLIATNLDNVVAAHIHVAAPGTNGPVVQFLFGNAPAAGGRQDGVLATGTSDGSQLVGPLAGKGLSALIAAMDAGNTYVNVHTNDGVAPGGTGPGDLPAGEIRGQVRVLGKDE